MAALFPEEINFPDDTMGPLAMAIGGVVLGWGSAEASLNICVVVIFTAAGGKPHADKNEVPVALGRKLKFLRLCFKKITVLHKLQEMGLSLCTRAGALAQRRNDLIHGFISNYDAQTGKYTFTNLGSEKDVPLIKGQPQYTIHEIMEIGGECLVLGADLVAFAKRLTDQFVG